MKRLLNVGLLVVFVALLASVAVGAAPVYAQDGGRGSGQVIVGRNVNLGAGEVIDGDLAVFGGNLSMSDGSRVLGDVVVFGGNATIAGQVQGDVATIGGNIDLAVTARVQGDASAVGGRLHKDAGAQLLGQHMETGRFDLGRLLPGSGDVRFPFAAARAASFDAVTGFLRIFRAVLISVVVGVIGLLVVLFLPEHARVIGNTIDHAAAASFGVGLLTLIVGVAVIAVLVITLCLAPIGILLALPLALATLLGWAVVGYLLGQRLMPLLKREAAPAPIVTALVGVLVLTAVHQGLTLLGSLPCLGFFFWLLGAAVWVVGASLGLGAVVLSRFGTQAYPGAAPIIVPPPPPGALPAPIAPAAAPAPERETSAADAAVPPITAASPAPVDEVPAPAAANDMAAGPVDDGTEEEPRRRAPRRKKPDDLA